jgi:RES domain-containing protein
MKAWRIARKVHADLGGAGARITGGRLNSPGRPAVYLASEASLALLEVRVHLDLSLDLLPDDYVYMEIELGDLDVEDAELPPEEDLCRGIGNQWLESLRTPLLRVPSVIVPFSSNLILNPKHREAGQAKIVDLHGCSFDPRLWRP